jgi:hypothetical protein
MKTESEALVPNEGDIVAVNDKVVTAIILNDNLAKIYKDFNYVKRGLSLERIEADKKQRDEKVVSELLKYADEIKKGPYGRDIAINCIRERIRIIHRLVELEDERVRKGFVKVDGT